MTPGRPQGRRPPGDPARDEAAALDRIAEALEPEWHQLVDPDPANLMRSLGRALVSDLAHPLSVAALTATWMTDLGRAALAGAARSAGADVDGRHPDRSAAPAGGGGGAKPDPRFADPAWEENAWFSTQRRS